MDGPRRDCQGQAGDRDRLTLPERRPALSVCASRSRWPPSGRRWMRADLLRQLAGCGVQVRPTQPCRLAGPYRWRILVTSAPLEASRLTALEEDLQGIARRAPGIRFTGWLFLRRHGEPKAPGVVASTTAEALGVLIVDESAPFRRAARALLERRGYSVVGEAEGRCNRPRRGRAPEALSQCCSTYACPTARASTCARCSPANDDASVGAAGLE